LIRPPRAAIYPLRVEESEWEEGPGDAHPMGRRLPGRGAVRGLHGDAAVPRADGARRRPALCPRIPPAVITSAAIAVTALVVALIRHRRRSG